MADFGSLQRYRRTPYAWAFMDSPWEHLDRYCKRFLSNNFKLREHTDLTIRCQGEEFYVHKIVLAANSEFFANACKPGSFKESMTGIIELDDEDPQMVQVMLCTCYDGDLGPGDLKRIYDPIGEIRDERRDYREKDILSCIAFYRIADKYQIRPFMERMTYSITCDMVDIYSIPSTSHRTPNDGYLTPSSFVRITREIFKTIPRGKLHHIPLRYAAKHLTYLNRSQEFKEMMDEIVGFRDELLDHIATINHQTRECGHCKKKVTTSLVDPMNKKGGVDVERSLWWWCPECKKYNRAKGMNKPSDTPDEENAVEPTRYMFPTDESMDDEV